MDNVWSRRTFLRGAGLVALLLLAAAPPSQARQDKQTRYAIERAQLGVSGKIIEERGGTWSDVTFDQARTQTWRISDRQTGGRGEGRDERRIPRWLVGSWNGRSPSNQRRVTVTVGSDGAVSALYNNGSREEGAYDNGRIRFNNSTEWDVSRVDEGFRAAVGTRSEVFRQGSGGGGRDDDDGGGGVPRWARGTFRGTTDSGEAELVIRADGTATARSLTKNQSFPGTYSNGRLRFEWGTFEVERTGDGIRTVQTNNRNNRTGYRRTGN